eukprot:EG_transcript_9127
MLLPHRLPCLRSHGLRQQRRTGWTLGLNRRHLEMIRREHGTKALAFYLTQKAATVAVVGGMIGWMVWMQYNRKRVPDDNQIYHAWLAVQAAQSDDPVKFVNHPHVRRTTDFQSVAYEGMFKGNLRLVLLETPDTMYLAFRGPVDNQADTLLRTNRIDSTDVTPRDRAHSGCLKFMDGVPVFNIFDDANWFDRHLVLCGAGLGGILAHNLLLQEVFKGHISALNHRVRSIAFGTPFCNHKKTREEIDERTWKNLFLTVVNRKDPLPAMISATLDPALLDTASDKDKALFAKYKASLSQLLADPEADLGTPKGVARRERLEKQLLADFGAVRHLLRPEEPEFAHFDPVGNWLFLDPAGGQPHVEEEYKDYPPTHELIWKRKDLRQAFFDSAYLTNPVLADGRRSAYDQTIRQLCCNEERPPATNRRLPVLDVAFPVYIPPKWR